MCCCFFIELLYSCYSLSLLVSVIRLLIVIDFTIKNLRASGSVFSTKYYGALWVNA